LHSKRNASWRGGDNRKVDPRALKMWRGEGRNLSGQSVMMFNEQAKLKATLAVVFFFLRAAWPS
jgi:hypothetical protein